jgi:hypothetical protein
VIAHFHHRQRSGDIGRGDMQQLRLLKLAQRLQLLLFVLFRHAQQILTQLIAIGIGRRRLIQRVGIQQLIQQQRMARQLAGTIGAAQT